MVEYMNSKKWIAIYLIVIVFVCDSCVRRLCVPFRLLLVSQFLKKKNEEKFIGPRIKWYNKKYVFQTNQCAFLDI